MGGKSSVEYHRAYRAANHARILAVKAAWREANREKINAGHREWTYANLDHVHASQAKSRAKNIDKVRANVAKNNALHGKAYSARYRAKHPDRRRESNRKWTAANLERVKAARRQYLAQNKDKLAAKSSRRRALKFQAIPDWFEADKVAEIYQLAQGISFAMGEEYHVDHIVPLNSSLVCGLHCAANLQILPARLNLSKGNRDWPGKRFGDAVERPLFTIGA
jgi:hypothetical protein